MIHLCIEGKEQKLTFRGNKESHLLFHTVGSPTIVNKAKKLGAYSIYVQILRCIFKKKKTGGNVQQKIFTPDDERATIFRYLKKSQNFFFIF